LADPRPFRNSSSVVDSEAADFEMRPGQLTASVGPSGAGKTTITHQVPLLHDPNEGRVLLDGHGLRDILYAGTSGGGVFDMHQLPYCTYLPLIVRAE
jgi:ATP-binding cassette subfamily B protein